MQESDLHDKLMLAFRDYFEANERWETKQSGRSCIDARNALGQIRIIARQRRMEMQRQRKEKKLKSKGNENE